MAHEIAFSTRTGRARMGSTEKEWHFSETNHTIWNHPPTPEQVIRDLDLDTEIQVRPIFDQNHYPIPEMMETWRGNYDRNNQPMMNKAGVHEGIHLGLVGPRYTPIQEPDLIHWFDPWVEAGLAEIHTFGAIYGGRRIFGSAKIKREMIDIQPNDPIASYIAIYNGHDGSLAFKAFPSSIRPVCKNTITLAFRSRAFNKFTVRHSGDVEKKLELVQDALAETEGMFLSQAEKFRFLARHQVKNEEELRKFFTKLVNAKEDEKEKEETGQKIIAVNGKEVVEEVEQEKEKGSYLVNQLIELYETAPGNRGATYWDCFNSWTYFLTQLRGRTVDARLDAMYAGTTARQNLLACGFALGAIQGKDLKSMTMADARKMAMV